MRKNEATKRRALAMACLALLMCCAAPCALARSYRYGDEAEEIAILQEALEELDFYYTDITGHYGARTQSAVRKFQKRYGLVQTGVADEQTIELIYLKAGMEAPEVGSSVLPQENYGATILREGSRSDAVRILQESLALLKFYSGSITGNYGRLTKEAVRRFQRANDLSADGVAGPRTFEKLTELLKNEGAVESPMVTLPSAESTTSTTSTANSVAAAGVSLKNVAKLNTERTLRRTSRSGYVTRLQKALCALGYYSGSADGSFGEMTEEAVKTYQAAKGLTVDGVAGRATLRSINSDLSNGITASTVVVD